VIALGCRIFPDAHLSLSLKARLGMPRFVRHRRGAVSVARLYAAAISLRQWAFGFVEFGIEFGKALNLDFNPNWYRYIA